MSNMDTMSHSDVADATYLDRFRRAQRLSYECVEAVAGRLRRV